MGGWVKQKRESPDFRFPEDGISVRDPHEIIYHPEWELNHCSGGCSHDAGWMVLKLLSCCL